MIARLLSIAAAFATSSLLLWLLLKLLFRGAVARASQLVSPKAPNRLDVAMSELGNEVAYWRFSRLALLIVLIPACFVFTFSVVRSILRMLD